MKNIKKYLILFVISFLSFIGVTNADKEFKYLTPGTTVTFISGTLYTDVACNVDEVGDLFEIIVPISGANNGKYNGDFKVKMKSEGDGTATLNCTYGIKYKRVGNSKVVDSTNGTMTFEFVGSALASRDIEVNMDRQSFFKLDLKSYAVDFKSVESIEIISDNQSNNTSALDLSGCVVGSSSCNVMINATTDATQVKGKLNYNRKNGNVDYLNFTINIDPEWFIRVVTGDYGDCASVLSSEPYGFSPEGNSANVFSKFVDTTNSGITLSLPKCDVKATVHSTTGIMNPLYEFDSWVYVKSGDYNKPYLHSVANLCATASTESPEHYGRIEAGEVFSPLGLGYDQSGKSAFYACYKSTGIILMSEGGTFPDSFGLNGWNVSGNNYYSTSLDTVVLPELTPPIWYSEFVGWKEVGLNSEDVIHNAGETVSAKDGKMYKAEFSRTAYNFYSETKEIYAGKTLKINLNPNYTCEVFKNDYLSVTNPDECLIHGIKASNDYIEVHFKHNNSEQGQPDFILKVLVKQNFTIGDLNIIGDDFNVESGTSDEDNLASIHADSAFCSEFDIKAAGDAYWSNEVFEYTKNGYKAKIHTYLATTSNKCGVTKTYSSLCLDPGRYGPGSAGTTYVFNRYLDLNINPHEAGNEQYYLDRAVAYMIYDVYAHPVEGESFKDRNNSQKLAANIAARILAFQSGLQLTDDVELTKGHNAYKALYESVKSCLSDADGVNSIEGCLHTGLNGENKSWNWSSDDNKEDDGFNIHEIYRKIVEYLDFEYKSNELGLNDRVVTPQIIFEKKESADPTSGEGDILILMPKDSSFLATDENGNLKYDASGNVISETSLNPIFYCADELGFNCMIVENSESTGITTEYDEDIYDAYYFKVVISARAGIVPTFPAINDSRMVIKFRYQSPFSSQNAFWVVPKGGANIQRMLLFSNEPLSASLPVNFVDCDVLYNNSTIPDNEKYAKLKEIGCCSTISEDTDFYRTQCKSDCIHSNYEPVCGNTQSEHYEIHEATRKNGNENFGCIVDVRTYSSSNGTTAEDENARKNTDSATDVGGINKMSVKELNDNPYCAVSCKEDWTFDFPGYNNFVGVNAAAAGSLFQVTNSIELGNTRTCVSSYIDKKQYMIDVQKIETDLLNAYKDYAARTKAYKEYKVISVGDGLGKNKPYYVWSYERYECSKTSGDHKDFNSTFCSVSGDYVSDTCTYDERGVGGCECKVETPATATTEATYKCEVHTSCTSSDYNHDGCTVRGDWYKITSTKDASTHSCNSYKLYIPEDANKTYTYYLGHDSDLYSSFGGGSSNANISNPGSHNTTYSEGDNNHYSGKLLADAPSNGKCVNYSESSGYGDDTPTEQEVKDYWLTYNIKYNTNDSKNLMPQIVALRTIINAKREDMVKAANSFSKCNNFYLENTSDLQSTDKSVFGSVNAALKDNNSEGTLSFTSSSAVRIPTKFDPATTFGYDEEIYMTMIGTNNKMIVEKSLPSVGTRVGYKRGSSFNVESFNADYTSTADEGSFDPKSKKFQICVPLDENVYSYDSTKQYCHNIDFYYYDTDYIKLTLSKNASYINGVKWYQKTDYDIKSPGVIEHTLNTGTGITVFNYKNTFSNALKTAKDYFPYANLGSVDDEKSLWSPMGTKNVFPISLSTKRNMYQYFYQFTGIGMYPNDGNGHSAGDTGRIIGNVDSVVKSNVRVCFYEVYESVCTCCGGATVNGIVSEASGVNTKKYLETVIGNQMVLSSAYIKGNGSLGYNSSSVSLGNFKNSTSANNWSANDEFFYDGKKYTTDKGSELADYIQGKGETIYEDIPEYSYTLTPEGMSYIRSITNEISYGINSDSLYVVNDSINTYSYKIKSSNNDFTLNDEDNYSVIKFNHFGSKFIRDTLGDYETDAYKGNLNSSKGMNNDCYVESGNVNNLDDKKASCKWVDYVVRKDGSYYRLSFK